MTNLGWSQSHFSDVSDFQHSWVEGIEALASIRNFQSSSSNAFRSGRHATLLRPSFDVASAVPTFLVSSPILSVTVRFDDSAAPLLVPDASQTRPSPSRASPKSSDAALLVRFGFSADYPSCYQRLSLLD